MVYAIDVVFIDRDWRVVRVGRLRPLGLRACRRAAAVLELAPGEAARLGIVDGELIRAVTIRSSFGAGGEALSDSA